MSRFEKLDTKSSTLQKELERLVGAHQSMADTAVALEHRVDSLSAKDTEFDRTLIAVNDQIREMDARIQGLGAGKEETVQIRDQLETLQSGAESDRGKLESMEQQVGVLAEQSVSLGERLEDLERRIAELVDHGQVLGSRIDDNRDKVQSLEGELAATREELEQLGARVGVVEGTKEQDTALEAMNERFSRIEAAIVDSDNRRAVQIDGTVENLAHLSHRQEKLEAEAKSTEDAVGDAKTLLHKTGEMLLETREGLRANQVNIDNARSGLRVLAWSGVVAAVALAVLSIAGYLLQNSKQQVLHESLVKSVDRVEHRIDPIPEWDIQRAENLEQDVGDLRSAVRELQHSVVETAPLQAPGQFAASEQILDEDMADQPQAAKPNTDSTPFVPQAEPESKPLADVNAVEAIPGVDQANSVDAPNPLVSDESTPEPQAVKPEMGSELPGSQQEHQPEQLSETNSTEAMWRTAQQERHYTIQLLGGLSLPSLTEYAAVHGLGENNAVLETTRNGKPWFALFNGHFKSWTSASKALKQLPPSLLSRKPWVRRLPASGHIAPLD